MPLHTAEAFVLRTWPLKESDKIVSFFTREFGKVRGVARGARRPKSKYGSSLEPLSQIRVQYFARENRDLANLDHADLLQPSPQLPLAVAAGNLLHSMAVSVMVEVADRMLPEHEASDSIYRLLLSVSPALRSAPEPAAWLPFTYYLYWMVRLGGFLPPLESTEPGLADLAGAIARTALERLPLQSEAAGLPGRLLRQKLKWCIEDHLEARLLSWPMLASLDA
ncbi:MAG: DNA repair protein RecO [Terriglobales bacterium]